VWKLLLQIAAGILGLWLANKFVPGVQFLGHFWVLPGAGAKLHDFFGSMVFIGTLLGLINFFVKPIIKTITLPIRIITLNLFTVAIAMGTVWAVDIFSPELVINGIIPLFWTTAIIWLLSFVISKWLPD